VLEKIYNYEITKKTLNMAIDPIVFYEWGLLPFTISRRLA